MSLNRINFRIHSKDEVDRQFDMILKTCEDENDYNTIIETIHKTFDGGLMPCMMLDEKLPDLKVYRVTAREPIDINGIASFSHPTANKTARNRANIEGHPVFYSAFTPGAAMREMKDKLSPGCSLYLSEWSIKFRRKINAYTLLFNSTTRNQELFPSQLGLNHRDELLSALKNPQPEVSTGLEQYMLRLGDLFALAGDKYYNITSALAHEVLYELRKQNTYVDMLWYPAMESNQDGINIAIHPDFVKSSMMQCTTVIKLRVNSIGDEGINVSVSQKAFAENNNTLSWKRPSLTVDRIEYDKFVLHTYNERVYTGVSALEQKVNQSTVRVKDILDRELDKYLLRGLQDIPFEDDIFAFTSAKREHALILELMHGNQVETDLGESCIKYMVIPVQWTDRYA